MNKLYTIGITVHADDGEEDALYPQHPLLYVERDIVEIIHHLGLVPYLIPVFRDGSIPILDHLDGFIITGGGYLSPHLNNDDLGKLEATSKDRYITEKKIIQYAIMQDLPLIGICRGAQMINEVLGGSLKNITNGDIEHFQERKMLSLDKTIHDIEINSESNLFNIINKKILPVNSLHRQQMTDLGNDLMISALSKEDKIIEAFESVKHRFLFGFQFHPEKLWNTHQVWQDFFKAFAEAVQINKTN